MGRKIISIVMAFCMVAGVVGMLPLTISAATYEGDCGTNVTYTLNTSTGVLKISGTGAMADYTYSSSAPWYSYRSYIKSVTISDGVTSIGSQAFYYCTSLTSVTIGDNVTSIGNSAFRGCSGLTSVTIPGSVTSIGEYAFSGCSSLTSVTIGGSVTSIGNSAFEYCSSLTSVTIPDSVTSIGYNAFSGCSSLTSVTIGGSVTSIGYYAFYNCTGLTEINWNAKNVETLSSSNYVFYNAGKNGEGIKVTFGDSVEKIPAYCFYPYSDSSYAPKITSVVIGDSVTSIGSAAFSGCSSLTSMTIPDSVTSIGSAAFSGCSSLTSMTIPDSVTSIEDSTFRNCSSLTSITIPDSVTSIGSGAFYRCNSLTRITIPDSVTTIGTEAFYRCEVLQSIEIPDSVTSLGNGAFSGCWELASATIGKGITKIDVHTFNSCGKLASITIPSSVKSIGNYAFMNCTGLKDVYYYGPEDRWNEIEIGTPDTYNQYLMSATKHYIASYSGEITDNMDWALYGDGLLVISGTGAMADYADTTDMPWAEYAADITKIVIEDGVTTVGARAFYGLKNVTEVQIADSVTAINTNAFRNCTSLTEISLPANVTELGTYAFSGCTALTTVNMYNKVEKIGNFAFYNCKALTDVYYDGTQEAWDSVSVGSFNTGLTAATIHVKAAATVTIDGVSTDYNTLAAAIASADEAGKAAEIKLLVNSGEVTIEPEYAHTIDLNGCTVDLLNVEGEVKLENGTVTKLNVVGITVTENVTVADTNATASGTDGTKSVYTSYDLGVSIVEGAQVRIGGGLVDGKIDAGSGLRFVGQANMADTLASLIMGEQYANGEYTDGFGIGVEIGAQDSDNRVYVEATKWQDASNSVFSAAVTGLVASNFNRNYTARCYVEYDGVKIFEEGSTTRSMYTVASGLLINNKAVTDELIAVLNAYVNHTGVRLTLTKNNEFSARMTGSGAYTGEAFFTVGETMCEEGMYMVTLTPLGQAKINVDLFNSYVRINNNNSLVSPVTFIMDNEDGTYTLVFDYSSIQ